MFKRHLAPRARVLAEAESVWNKTYVTADGTRAFV
jgi:hypothetical protein